MCKRARPQLLEITARELALILVKIVMSMGTPHQEEFVALAIAYAKPALLQQLFAHPAIPQTIYQEPHV